VYRHKAASDRDFSEIDQLFKVVMGEDKQLCNAAQHNLNAGIFLHGQLHPQAEKVRPFFEHEFLCNALLTQDDLKGPLYFQRVTKELVTHHRRDEELSGCQLWPATPKSDLPGSQEDIDFCASLDCAGDVPELDW